jgi:hypothetical protein
MTSSASSRTRDSALHAPNAGFGDTDFHRDVHDKAAVFACRIAWRRALHARSDPRSWLRDYRAPRVDRYRVSGAPRESESVVGVSATYEDGVDVTGPNDTRRDDGVGSHPPSELGGW